MKVTCSKQFNLTVMEEDFGNITPPITSTAGATWGIVPAGLYKVVYVEGALRYANTAEWWLNGPFPNVGYYVQSSNPDVQFPGTHAAYGNQLAVEVANAGAEISVTHGGGVIGVYLFDIDFSENYPGTPNPTFHLMKIT